MGDLIFGSSIASFADNWNMGFHSHETIEISVVLSGQGWFEYAEQRCILETGNVVLIDSSLSHNYQSTSPIRFAVLEVMGMGPTAISLFKQLLTPTGISILSLSLLNLEQYETLFRLWLREISQPHSDSDRYVRSWVDILLLFLQRHAKFKSNSVSIATVEEYIRSHLQTELLISALAKMINLSEASFRTLFKNTYGMTPKKYQLQCRMSEAKWLLRSSDKSIQSISDKIGFSSQHAFSSWFQVCESMSPTSWRKAQQGLHTDAAVPNALDSLS